MSVRLNGNGTYQLINQPSNFITSYYGQDNDFSGFIERANKEEKVLFVSKEKSQNLYRQLELQLPQGFYRLGFDNIIRQSAAVVNIQSMQEGVGISARGIALQPQERARLSYT